MCFDLASKPCFLNWQIVVYSLKIEQAIQKNALKFLFWLFAFLMQVVV